MSNNPGINYFVKTFELIIVFFYKCIRINVMEQMVNPIYYKVTGVVINLHNKTIFESVILTGNFLANK